MRGLLVSGFVLTTALWTASAVADERGNVELAMKAAVAPNGKCEREPWYISECTAPGVRFKYWITTDTPTLSVEIEPSKRAEHLTKIRPALEALGFSGKDAEDCINSIKSGVKMEKTAGKYVMICPNGNSVVLVKLNKSF